MFYSTRWEMSVTSLVWADAMILIHTHHPHQPAALRFTDLPPARPRVLPGLHDL